MNRLVPLIARAPARSGPARLAAIDPSALEHFAVSEEDLRLFLTAFAAGLVFFATLFG
jgi:hypothetical protein